MMIISFIADIIVNLGKDQMKTLNQGVPNEKKNLKYRRRRKQ